MLTVGVNPLDAYRSIWTGSVGSGQTLGRPRCG